MVCVHIKVNEGYKFTTIRDIYNCTFEARTLKVAAVMISFSRE